MFLGHLVDSEGVRTNPALVKDIKEQVPPHSLKKLQAYLGLCNYYRRFVPGFASIAGPLNHLLVKGVKFKWEETQQQAFKELKQRLASSPVLAYPRQTGTFILDTDASDTSIRAVLSQEQEGRE